MDGWIKLHRKFNDTSFKKNPIVVALFVHLLTNANHQSMKIVFNRKEVILEAGELVTTRNSLSRETGITPQSIRTALVTLKSTNTITIKSTNKFSIISVLNWKSYQHASTNTSTSKLTNDQPTTNQQLTSTIYIKNNKNVKNNKNNKKEEQLSLSAEVAPFLKGHPTLESITAENILQLANDYQVPEAFVRSKLEDLDNYCKSSGRKYKDYLAALRNFVKGDSLKIRKEHNANNKRVAFIS